MLTNHLIGLVVGDLLLGKGVPSYFTISSYFQWQSKLIEYPSPSKHQLLLTSYSVRRLVFVMATSNQIIIFGLSSGGIT